MSDSKISKGMYFILFLISTAATVAFLIFQPQWFWLMLPFVLTFFVKATNLL